MSHGSVRFVPLDPERPLNATEARAYRWLCEWIISRGLPVKCRPQQKIGPYYADFVLDNPLKWVIEADGPLHEAPEAQRYDRRRDDFMKKLGFRIVRIKADLFWRDGTLGKVAFWDRLNKEFSRCGRLGFKAAKAPEVVEKPDVPDTTVPKAKEIRKMSRAVYRSRLKTQSIKKKVYAKSRWTWAFDPALASPEQKKRAGLH